MSDSGADNVPLLAVNESEAKVARQPRSKLRLDRILMLFGVVVSFGVIIAVIVGNVASDSSIVKSIKTTFSQLNNPLLSPYDPYTNGKNPNYIPSFSLPRTFRVPATMYTPVKSQGSRDTSWAFSTLGMLEADYRDNGIRHKWLKENEYVSFSEQAYSIGVVEYCQSHPEETLCFGTGPAKNSTDNASPEFLYYFGSEVQKVLPESACPYEKLSVKEFDCVDRQVKLEKNPIHFRVKHIESEYSLSGVKKLLKKYNKPLTWTSSLFQQTYLIPCSSNELFLNTTICKECAYPIDPVHPEAGCYALYIVPSYNFEGIYSLVGKPLFKSSGSMVLVGYNDNFRVDSGKYGKLKERTLGGFILKNSDGYSLGHSIKYWTQEISAMEESLLCPDEYAATNWIPVDTDCMLSGGNINNCSTDTYKRVRGVWVTGATVLICQGITKELATFYGFSNCDPTLNYALASIPQIKYLKSGQASGVWFETPEDGDGSLVFNLIQFNPLNATETPVLVKTTKTTWLGLSKIFKPSIVQGNDPNVCGYFFYPYQYFQEAHTFIAGRNKPETFTYYDIEWDESSYLVNKDKYPSYDYSFLEASTKTINDYHFNGPLDFDVSKQDN